MTGRRYSLMIQPVPASAQVADLLADSSLPVADLSTCQALQLFAAYDGDALLGVVGLELYGAVALLRSLAVRPADRENGLGKILVAFAEKQAAELGVKLLYLLTTTAAPFFAKLGYENAERGLAPEAIRSTSQFSGLCPASSSFMVKQLRA